MEYIEKIIENGDTLIMEKVIEILNQIDTGDVGIVIYSNLKKKVVFSSNEQLIVPLASAGKVGIAYCIAKMVEDGHVSWTDSIDDIVLDSNEDSKELYPHFQNRNSLTLSEAVEVMIACHDNLIAKRIVQYCGGWEYISDRLSFYFEKITIKEILEIRAMKEKSSRFLNCCFRFTTDMK